MREDTRSPIWGGATVGLVIGVILGFFVGTYWMTVLYAVLIGAGVGLATNMLAWLGSSVARRGTKTPLVYRETNDEERRENLRTAERILRGHSPVDSENSVDAAMELQECVGVVGWVEEEELWQAGYDSLESFYGAHESQHPDIRVYAAVESQTPMADAAFPLHERAEVIAQRIASHRPMHPGN